MASHPDPADYLRPETVPAPADNLATRERIDLGRHLFFDPRLSGSNWISCATCHNPTLGWSDSLPTAIGDGQKRLDRATPTILNTAYAKVQFWDGRARTLEQQATGPIVAPGEMNQDMDELIGELGQLVKYREMFERAYPGEGITKRTIAKALASFERTVVSQESPFDRWVRGDDSAISDTAKRGFRTFTGKANCAAYHMGWNFADDGFHNIGLKNQKDQGRFAHIPVKVLKGAFKTPTLRNVALTAPYFHDGSVQTLREVVEHYNRAGDDRENLDPNMQPLNLTDQEMDDLVEFMKTLTDYQPAGAYLTQLPVATR